MPLYHIFAFTVCSLLGMRVGAMNVLIPNPRDLPALVKEIKAHRVNIFPAVNTLYNALAHHAGERVDEADGELPRLGAAGRVRRRQVAGVVEDVAAQEREAQLGPGVARPQ